MRKLVGLMAVALIASPAYLFAQRKEDILAIQRDIASLTEQVRNLQKAQEDKIDALQQLLQQSVTANSQLPGQMKALQQQIATTISTTLADQQTKTAQNVTTLSSQVDALARSVDQFNQTLSQVNGRLDKLDQKLQDISDKVSTLNQPAPPPPAAPSTDTGAAPGPGAALNTTPTPPPGTTRIGLHDAAERDYSSGGAYDKMALEEFADYIKYFPMDEYAPRAMYYIGKIYQRQKDYDDAIQAFQKLIDTWPQNNVAQDALFQKAVCLRDAGEKAEAIDAYKEFIDKYKANDYIPTAKADLKKLTTPAARRRPVR